MRMEGRLDNEWGCLDIDSIIALRKETSTLKYTTQKAFTF